MQLPDGRKDSVADKTCSIIQWYNSVVLVVCNKVSSSTSDRDCRHGLYTQHTGRYKIQFSGSHKNRLGLCSIAIMIAIYRRVVVAIAVNHWNSWSRSFTSTLYGCDIMRLAVYRQCHVSARRSPTYSHLQQEHADCGWPGLGWGGRGEMWPAPVSALLIL